jgi:hypothetical protein
MRVEIARAINLRNIYGADYEMMMMMMIARTDIPDRVIGNNKMRTIIPFIKISVMHIHTRACTYKCLYEAAQVSIS